MCHCVAVQCVNFLAAVKHGACRNEIVALFLTIPLLYRVGQKTGLFFESLKLPYVLNSVYIPNCSVFYPE